MPIYANWSQGIGRSESQQDAFATLINCDIHSKPGQVQSSFLLAKNSGTTVTELCKNAVIVSNGDSFWFSSESGKIWKRTYAGVWSLVYTSTTGITYGAALYNGFIYFASETYLGRISESLASSEASWTSSADGWATFLVPKNYHPMVQQGATLYIGDNIYIATVNTSATFSNNALDLPPNQVTTALFPYEEDLVIGTIVQDNFSKGGTFRWDRFSDAPTLSDYTQENGVDMFINADNSLLALVGIHGSVYEYTGAKMERILKLKNADSDMNGTVDLLADGTCNFYGKPCINHKYGVYTLYRNDSSFPLAANIEWRTSGGALITPGSIKQLELNLLVAWKSVSSVGVDMISANKANGQIITPIYQGTVDNVIVNYDLLPTGTSITIETKVNGGSWINQTVIVDTINKQVYFDGGLGQVNDFQARITMVSSTVYTPVIQFIEVI